MKLKLNMKKIFVIVIAILIVLLCNVNAYAEDTFTLEKESVDVKLNGTAYISYTGGSGAITWESSDETVATIEDGRIEGLKIGETTITATRGSEVKTCKVNVIYNTIKIGGNSAESVNAVNLVLNDHETENLFAEVEDDDYNKVNNPDVRWSSSDSSIVTVDENTGTITAVKAGKATITASAAGVVDTCEVTVLNAPVFTDFTNAKYETELNGYTETLKISNVTPNDNDYYYYIITPSNIKPNLVLKHGSIDTEIEGQDFDILRTNSEENYMYTRNLAEYSQYNQDLYLWVIQQTKLEDWYYESAENYVAYSTRFVVEGKKITRSELPKLNLIIQTFNIGYWSATQSYEAENYTYMRFNFPSNVENRKFNIKIGKVTDSAILSKIQKNDYSGITELLTYAKNNKGVYSDTLTTTDIAYYRNDSSLFDGRKLLENKAYYYIYVEFDDDNGKYIPVEGVTLGQAWFSTSSDSWDLWAYTSDEFKWDNLTSTPSDYDGTTADKPKLPNAGVNILYVTALVGLVVITVVGFKKYQYYKGIK